MAGKRIVIPNYMPALDLSGNPVAGARLTFYENETTDLKAIYTNAALTVQHTNPVIANAAGVFASIFADEDEEFSVAITDSDGVPISGLRNYDNVSPAVAYGLGDAVDAGDLPYLAEGADAVSRSMGSKLGDYLNAADYGVVADGTTDDSAALLAAIDEAITQDKPLRLPSGTILVTTAIELALSDYTTYQSAFCPGVRIEGNGVGRTIIDSRVASGYWLTIDNDNPHTSTFQGILGGWVKGLTIRNGATTTASSGIKIVAQFMFSFEDLHIIGLSGTGITVECVEGDLDGSNQLTFERVRIENCGGWGIDSGAGANRNEISLIRLQDVIIQNCGTDESLTITGITKANPAVVTVTGTAPADGTLVYLNGIGGMTEIDSFVANNHYKVANRTATTFEVQAYDPANLIYTNLDTSGVGYTAYTSGGKVLRRDPQSGGFRWKGQMLRVDNSGWAINKNVSVYIPGGAGAAQDVLFTGSTIENPQGVGFQTTGVFNLRFIQQHIYSNATQAGGANYAGMLFDGALFQVANVIVEQPMLRSTAAETNYVAIKVMGILAKADTIKVRDIAIKQFDYTGQRRVEGVVFEPVPHQARLTVTSTTNIGLYPSDTGRFIPVRRASPVIGTVRSSAGSWVAYPVPSTGINQPNLTPLGAALANNTTYEVYLFDDEAVSTRPDLELSTTAPVRDSLTGYKVMTGDATKLWVGRVRTDGSGLFVTTDTGWLNPTRVPGGVTGADAYEWTTTTNGYKYHKKSETLPTSVTAADYTYKPTYETSIAYDPPSLAAGAERITDFTVSCGAGDLCLGVGFSLGWGNITAIGTVKAANTVSLYEKNTTAGAIDLGSGNLRIEVLKR